MPDTELLDWVCENNKYFDIIRSSRLMISPSARRDH